MIIDVSGVVLTPGNGGVDCLGNGRFFDENGEKIECCCDECDYMLCCFFGNEEKCKVCTNTHCEKSPNYKGEADETP